MMTAEGALAVRQINNRIIFIEHAVSEIKSEGADIKKTLEAIEKKLTSFKLILAIGSSVGVALGNILIHLVMK